MRIAIILGVLAATAGLAAAQPCDYEPYWGPGNPPPPGFGMSIGAFSTARAAHVGSSDMFDTNYTYDATSFSGGMLTLEYAPSDFIVAWDLGVAGGSITGTATYTGNVFPGSMESTSPIPFTGTQFMTRTALRFGPRVKLSDDVALAGGIGIGGDMVMGDTKLADHDFSLAMAPNDMDADLFFPVWAGATVKGQSGWGFEAYASYDYHPSSPAESEPTYGASLLYAP